MILIFGGTTEGRTAAETLDEAGQPFYYSTRGTLQEVTCRNMTRLTGNMDSEKIISFCREHDIRLIIDAAHPFAHLPRGKRINDQGSAPGAYLSGIIGGNHLV